MPDIEITFLGTGTSHGIPVIACDCAVCTSPDPRDRRSRSSIYVRTPECAWVVDTGADFREQCLRARIHQLDAVVYTHAHTDHIMGFDDLRRFSESRGGIPVYASPDTMHHLRRVFTFAFNGENHYPGYVIPQPQEVTGPFFLGSTELVPLPVPHGRTLVNGYLFRRNGRPLVAYLSDCNGMPGPVLETIRGVDHLIIDALRHRPHPTHFTVTEALAVAKESGAAHTWLTHLCHDLPHAETEAALPPGVRIAHDGLRIQA